MTLVPEAHVKWANRAPMDGGQKFATFLGVGTLVLHLVVCVMIFIGKNGYVSFGAECKDGWHNVQEKCINDSLMLQQVEECWQNPGYNRRLTTEEVAEHGHWDILALEPANSPMLRATPRLLNELDVPQSMWGHLAGHPEIPAVMIVLVIFVGCGWILLLQKCAKPVVWAAIGVCILILVFLALLPTFSNIEICKNSVRGGIHNEWGETNNEWGETNNEWGESNNEGGETYNDDWVIVDDYGRTKCLNSRGVIQTMKGKFMVAMLPPAGIIALAAFFCRKQINVAAICLSKACLCLQQTCSIFGVAALCFICTGCFQAIWLAAMVESGNIFVWKRDPWTSVCWLEPSDSVETLRKILAICYMPTIYWMEYWLLVVVAAGVGGWYFKEAPDRPSTPAMQGFKWALGPSNGICFVAGCINSLLDALRRFTQKKCCFLNFPLYITFLMLWYCCLRQLVIFTRFMVVAHTFHGGGTKQVARNAFAVLRKHIGGAVVTDTIAHIVMRMGVIMFSGGLAFGSWAWMEDAVGSGILSDIMSGIGGNAVWVILLIGVTLGMLTFPRFWLVIIAMFAGLLKYNVIAGWLTGIFVGCVSYILFSYIAQIVTFAMDTIFYCFALEAEFDIQNTNADVQEMNAMVKEHIVKPVSEEYKNMVIEGVPADSAAVHAPVHAKPMPPAEVEAAPTAPAALGM